MSGLDHPSVTPLLKGSPQTSLEHSQAGYHARQPVDLACVKHGASREAEAESGEVSGMVTDGEGRKHASRSLRHSIRHTGKNNL